MSNWTNWRDNHWLGINMWWLFTMIDRSLNLAVHGDFKHTLSAYLGVTNPDCRLCRWLNKIEQDHCRKAARHEGLL